MKAVGLSMAAALVAAVSLGSCSKAEEQFSDEPCYFVFDNSVHQNSTLATAMASALGSAQAINRTRGLSSSLSSLSNQLSSYLNSKNIHKQST